MNASIEIFADLTVSNQGRELNVKAEGKTIRVYLPGVASIFRQGRCLTELLMRYRLLDRLDRVLASNGLRVAVHVGFFHVVVLGAGASRLVRSFLVYLGRHGHSG